LSNGFNLDIFSSLFYVFYVFYVYFVLYPNFISINCSNKVLDFRQL